MIEKINKKLFRDATKFIPGGVNSPVRAFKSVGGTPILISRGQGSKIYDVDGKSYIDYCLSWGALILGHCHPTVIQNLKNQLNLGTGYGTPTIWETEFAGELCTAYPSIELVRLVNSGTEATMSAIRLARGYTQKNKVIKFDGAYHGHIDYLLGQSGSGVTTFITKRFGCPNPKVPIGIPAEFVSHTLSLPYNNLQVVNQVVKKLYKEIACIIVEPIAGNMGVIVPEPAFLNELRRLCTKHQIVLIFDEIITGFRFNYGGVASLFNIKPDLVCLGKIIGGGLPIGAFGGKKEIMNHLSPLGNVYQAGTLSGNPLSVRAGLTTLNILKKHSHSSGYERLIKKTKFLCQKIKNCAIQHRISIIVNQFGSMFTVFFTQQKNVYDYRSVLQCDSKQYAKFFRGMLNRGIYLPPSPYESCFVSYAHTDEDIQKTINAAEITFRNFKQ